MPQTFCRACGREVDPRAVVCPACGVATGVGLPTSGDRRWLTALLLSIFLGDLGIDRFYLGLTGTGILKLVTFGGFGIWWIIDIVLIATGTLRDGAGQPIRHASSL